MPRQPRAASSCSVISFQQPSAPYGSANHSGRAPGTSCRSRSAARSSSSACSAAVSPASQPQLVVSSPYLTVVETWRPAEALPVRRALIGQGMDGLHAPRALVVPLLIASGGIEQKIPKLLSGLPYAYDGEALLPNPKLSRWIARQVEQLSALE